MQCLVCNAAAAVLWCHNDAAFLCVACDARIHSNLVAARHARVTLCEMCERKPATLYCTQARPGCRLWVGRGLTRHDPLLC